MHVTESPPEKTLGSRPTGLEGVVVSASLAPQQRIANDPNKALTVIKVPNEGYTYQFFAGRPQIGCGISKYKNKLGKKFTEKKTFAYGLALALCMLQRVYLQKFEGSRPANLGEVVVSASLAPQQPLFSFN
jgi:hypothetical protein